MKKEKETIDPIDVCKKTFGEFKQFKDKFIEMKFGSMPTSVHPNPRSIALVRNMDNWPTSFNLLQNMRAVCYGCQNQDLFSPCKMCLKAMVGECKQLKEEADLEYVRLKCELKKRK